MWNFKTNPPPQKKTKLTETGNRLVVAQGKGGWNGKGDQNVQTSSNKINKSWVCNCTAWWL